MADWDNIATVQIFSDNDEGLVAARLSVTTAGGRVQIADAIEASLDWMNLQLSADLVVIDIARDHGPLLDLLLDRINEAAANGRHASIVTVAPELIDIAAARLTDGGVMLMAAPDPAERALAVAEMLARPQGRRGLNDGVRRIAHMLARLSDDDGPAPASGAHETSGSPPLPPGDGDPVAEAIKVRAVLRARRLRDQFFGSEMFADPAWDMLLDLAASRIEQRPVAVSSLCIAAAVPATTALRWIKQLTDAELFLRVSDPLDGRRIFIELTDRAAQAMRSYLAAAARLGAVGI